jgi:hypothetical protein
MAALMAWLAKPNAKVVGWICAGLSGLGVLLLFFSGNVARNPSLAVWFAFIMAGIGTLIVTGRRFGKLVTFAVGVALVATAAVLDAHL